MRPPRGSARSAFHIPRVGMYPRRSSRVGRAEGERTKAARTFRFAHKDKAIVDAAGVAEIVIGPPPPGTNWLVERAVVRNTGAATPSLLVYVPGIVDDTHVAEGTTSGASDVADENQPVFINAGQTALWRWTGATVGSVSSLNAQIKAEPSW